MPSMPYTPPTLVPTTEPSSRPSAMEELKESKKTYTALLYTATEEKETVDPNSTPQVEMAKLRVAYAQILAAVADEGSRTERRIREAVAANASLTEADAVVERELHCATETTKKHMYRPTPIYQRISLPPFNSDAIIKAIRYSNLCSYNRSHQ